MIEAAPCDCDALSWEAVVALRLTVELGESPAPMKRSQC